MYFTYILPNGKEIKLKEFLYKDIRTFNLYQDASIFGRINFLESFILTKGLNVIEKFYALTYLRLQCIGSDVLLPSSKGDVGVSLEFLRESAGGIFDIETSLEVDDVIYTLDYPLNFNCGNDDFVLSIIKRIQINDEVLFIGELTENEQQEVIERLPKKLYNHIEKFVEDCYEYFNLTLLKKRENLDIETIEFNMLDYNFAHFVASLFRIIDSAGYKELLFSLSRRIKDVSFLANSTYLEVYDYFDLYRRELEAQNKSNKGPVS